MPFQIILGDITKMKTAAIVNAANTNLARGGGVCGAIFAAADDERLEEECRNIRYCPTGSAVYTKGYGLEAEYIIHACGPEYDASDRQKSEELLRGAYYSSLTLAKNLKIGSISFPLISSGIYSYPKSEALRIAVEEITNFVKHTDMSVYLVLYDKNEYVLDSSRFNQIDSYISNNMRKKYSRNVDTLDMVCDENDSSNVIQDILYKIDSKKSNIETRSFIDMDFGINELEETFSQMLLRIIKEKKKTHTEIYKKANIDRRLFSKIKNDSDYSPKKQTVIAFAIALELSLDEADDLLLKAGYALSRSSKFDVIIMYFISNKMFDIFEINEILFEYDQPLLGI